MSGATSIQWTDATWNPVRGCSRVSEGCRFCYAERIVSRFSGPGQRFEGFAEKGPWRWGRWTGRVELVPKKLDEPLHWRKPRRIFVNSMSDLFHESLSDHNIAAVFGVMLLKVGDVFQVLTKRPRRMLEWMRLWGEGESAYLKLHLTFANHPARDTMRNPGNIAAALLEERIHWPLPNVWLGVSVEDQKTADERIPLLLQTPAAVRFISAEPLLGRVDLTSLRIPLPKYEPYDARPVQGDIAWIDAVRGRAISSAGYGYNLKNRLDWVIVGGESGPGARPMDLAWARRIASDCRAAGVPVFVKQLGAGVRIPNDTFREWPEQGEFLDTIPENYRPRYQGEPVLIRMRDRKGGDPAEWPEDLRVREFPCQ